MDQIQSLVGRVLNEGYLMSLGTVDDGGPWVADLIFVVDENMDLYWMSKADARHSQAILKNPRVAGSVTVSNNVGEPDFGVQFEAVAEKIEGGLPEMYARYQAKRRKEKLPMGESAMRLAGMSWYRCRPSYYELIDKSKFGFEKQKLELGDLRP
jgi:uncharacterized protein YhbP (UPF0306 family)